MPEFVITLDGREIQRVRINKDLVAIGRAKENDIVIENLATSRHHAQISFLGGQYYLTDLDSSNGTHVNEKRVSRTQIVENDRIRVGRHEILFHLDAESELPVPDEFADFNQTMVLSSPKAMPPSHFLTVRAVRRRDQVVPLTEPQITIGRGGDCGIRIVDWFVDSQQAILEVRGGDCRLRNLGLTYPTLLNGRPFEEVLLRDGDIIQMGVTQLAYSTDSLIAQDPPGLLPIQQVEMPEALPSTVAHAESTVDSGLEKRATAVPVEEKDAEPAVVFSGKSDLVFEEAPDEQEIEAHEEEALAVEAQFRIDAAPLFEEPAPEIVSVGPDLEDDTPGKEVWPQDNEIPERDASEAPVAPDAELWSEGDTRASDILETAPPENVEEEEPQPFAPTPDEEEREAPVAAPPPPAPPEVSALSPAAARQVEMWEQALRNPSSAVRKQAARQLKRITGRDYDV